MIRIFHTKGDTDPLRVRLMRNSGAVDLTGQTVTLKVRPLGESEPTVIDAVMTPDADQIVNRGWVEYEWQPADDNLAEGVYEANIVTDDGAGGIKTFPTDNYDRDFFTIYLRESA